MFPFLVCPVLWLITCRKAPLVGAAPAAPLFRDSPPIVVGHLSTVPSRLVVSRVPRASRIRIVVPLKLLFSPWVATGPASLGARQESCFWSLPMAIFLCSKREENLLKSLVRESVRCTAWCSPVPLALNPAGPAGRFVVLSIVPLPLRVSRFPPVV